MANVLGELFGNIAAAIREKTGDTATMKPNEFPAKISGIEVGGGSGGGGGVKYGFFMKTISGSYGERVAVDFGFTPSFIRIAPGSNTTDGTKTYLLWGVSKTFKESQGLTGYSGLTIRNYLSSGVNKQEIYSTYIDGTDKAGNWIYGADATGFNIGRSSILAGSVVIIAFGTE